MLAMNRTENAQATASDLIVELVLFLCSYAPLFLILAIRFTEHWLEALCGGLFVLGLGGGLAVVLRYSGVSGRSWTATRVEDRGAEVAGYLASYILPFVVVPEPSWRDSQSGPHRSYPKLSGPAKGHKIHDKAHAPACPCPFVSVCPPQLNPVKPS